ncbi:sporulation protein [Streptomyces sp. C]|uniref:sporulation protein n=1 Tax=Streptomyces sp. C TaxID=253839 RepID=UPI00101B5231|nr:sporulation protein [Streptomyces sp. C]
MAADTPRYRELEHLPDHGCPVTGDARGPNVRLGALVEECGVSHRDFARRINAAAHAGGRRTAYTHTHVAAWLGGATPRQAARECIVEVLGNLLSRTVTLSDAGWGVPPVSGEDTGLDFPHDREAAFAGAVDCWRNVDRRDLLLTAGASFITPAFRWLADPADEPAARGGTVRVGPADVERLWTAAAEAQVADSRFGGGDWRGSQVMDCLRGAGPLLDGAYSASTGQALHAALAELSRVAGWAAMDAGDRAASDRLLIQSLRMARAAGDVEMGCYVLATMSLSAYLAGRCAQAAEMASAAYARGRGHAAPRVLAFCKLAEARALAKQGDGPGAGAALARCESLLSGLRPGSHDPGWISYMTPARMATDAVEVHRDLGQTRAAMMWAEQAGAMPVQRFSRAVGIRRAVLAGVHLIDGDLEPALADAHRAVDILGGVRSPRAHAYLHDVVGRLGRWRDEPGVRGVVHRVRSELPPAVGPSPQGGSTRLWPGG